MSVIRSFIAVDLPESLNQPLEQASQQLQELLDGLPVRWVPVQNIHLTLKFLGDVSEKNIPMIQNILHGEGANHHQFEIGVGGFGVFPNLSRPRVLWVGVEGPDELIYIQRGIDVETARLGYAPDQRKFNPHLTFGRVSRNASSKQVRKISSLLRNHKLGFLGAARIEDVSLFRSDLGPDGAVYSKIYTAKLST
ncbi:MAG: RNA 2',3'-cyclic phosphodiesterase [Gammaproteobacteria bacterium]|nr:RNA 2',3'-cyclic phosphodiesterase [Gammaproteobacteria bacterium]